MNTLNLSHRLEQCYSGVVYDALRSEGLRNTALPPAIVPLLPERRLAGPVFTVEGARTQASDHDTLLAWTGLLSAVPAGSVLLIQPNDCEQAYMGELSAETLSYRNVRGCVIDGNIRDSDFIRRLGFRTFCRGTSPVDVVGTWLPTSIGGSVRVGTVTVHTGDFIVADCDGAVVIPADRVEEITTIAEGYLMTESMVRQAILQGTDPQEAYIANNKF